jgi:hypothetical protein
MTRLSTRRIRRESSLATTNTMDRNSCWSHHGGRTWPSPSVPTSVLSICMTSVTPSQLNCRICLAPASSYGSPRRTNSRSSPLGGVAKNRNPRRDAALHEVRRFERPRAAGIERYDNMSANSTGPSTTSAHPAARRTGSRTGGTATIAAAANATTISSIEPHLGRRELMLRLMSKFRVRDVGGNAMHRAPHCF